MTSVVMQIRELPPFFPFWPYKWRNAFSQDSVRAESSARLCGHRERKQKGVLSGLWQRRFWQMKKIVIKF